MDGLPLRFMEVILKLRQKIIYGKAGDKNPILFSSGLTVSSFLP